MTDGIHWHEVMDPLVQHCSPWLQLVFVVYTAFTMLALMNILTGFFLESAMRIAEDENKQVVVEQISQIFRRGDVDNSGTISVAEFQGLLTHDEHLAFFLNTLDIHQEQAMQLFVLLDKDNSGEIDFDEFVVGCERLQGSAKAIDFAAFMCDWQVISCKMDRLLAEQGIDAEELEDMVRNPVQCWDSEQM